MNVFQARRVLEAAMTDRCTICRRRSVINSDGTTTVKLDTENPIVKNHKCRLSFSRYRLESAANKAIDENPVETNPKVFFPIFTDVKAGDYIYIDRMSTENEVLMKYEGILGLPAAYDTHTEAMLNIDTSA